MKLFQEVFEITRERNGELQESKIITICEKIRLKCHEGHRWTASLGTLRLGAWCPKCFFNKTNMDPKNQRFFKVKKEYHYLYKITCLINKKIYIGVHSTNNLEDEYLGSGKLIKRAVKKYGRANFYLEKLEFFDDSRAALSREKQIVTREFIKLNSNYNYAEGGGGGFVPKTSESSLKISEAKKNTVVCKNKQGEFITVSKAEFDSNPEYKGATEGICIMKDLDGKIVRAKVGDPRIKDGTLVGVTKGICVMQDKDGTIYKVDKDDIRIKTGELVGVTAGIKQSAESNLKRSDKLKGIPRPQNSNHSCIFCPIKSTKTNILRWHNGKCKKAP